MTRLLAAVAFLTRVPVGRAFEARDVGRSALFFPVVGAGIGLAQAALFPLLGGRLSALLVAVLIVSLSAWLTRAIHLDGLADFSDALGGSGSKEQALEILSDPRIGAFGAVSLVLVLGVKVAAIASLSGPEALVLAPALSRWASIPLSRILPYAREGGGLGSALTDHSGPAELLGATALALGLVFFVAPRPGLAALGAVVGVTVVVGYVARRRLGGVTGDVLGANVELSEAAALVAAVAA